MGHALTNQTIQAFTQSSNEGHAHLSLLCALERLLLIYCSFFSQLELNKYPLFHSNTPCFTNENAIPQITAFPVFTHVFPDKIEKYPFASGFDFQINL